MEDSNTLGLFMLALAFGAAGIYLVARVRRWPRWVRVVALGIDLAMAMGLITLFVLTFLEGAISGIPD